MVTTYTVYPDALDSSTELPVAVDSVTPVKAEVVNRQRSAILAIEAELGIQPSSTYTTVRARLDALDSTIADLAEQIEAMQIASGGSIRIKQDGTTIVMAATTINFTGSGVSVTDGGSTANIDITPNEFITQTDWYIDSVSGNNSNDGATSGSALLTVSELMRRLSGRVYSSTVSNVTINFTGSFSGQTLSLGNVYFAGPTAVIISGQSLTQIDTGTITSYTSFNAASNIRASLTDSGQDFSTYKQKRIRITSGAADTGVTRICSLGGANTIANIGQLRTEPTLANFWFGSNVNPSAGATYVVENFVTEFQRYDFSLLGGNAQVIIKNCLFQAPSPGAQTDDLVSYGAVGHNRGSIIFWGCDFSTPVVMRLENNATFLACSYRDGALLILGNINGSEACSCWFMPSQLQENSFFDCNDNIHDGDGLRCVSRFLAEGACQAELGHRGFFGNINGIATEHINVNGGAFLECQSASARLWGATGNTVTNAIKIHNGSGVVYTTKPTMTGNSPGSDVVLSNEPAINWASVPAKSFGNTNNAYIISKTDTIISGSFDKYGPFIGIAGKESTDVVSPNEDGKGCFLFNPASIDGYTSATFTFNAVLETTDGYLPAEIYLYNLTDGYIVNSFDSSPLITTSIVPTLLQRTLSLFTDLPAEEKLYQARIRFYSGTPTENDIVTCRLAEIRVT